MFIIKCNVQIAVVPALASRAALAKKFEIGMMGLSI